MVLAIWVGALVVLAMVATWAASDKLDEILAEDTEWAAAPTVPDEEPPGWR